MAAGALSKGLRWSTEVQFRISIVGCLEEQWIRLESQVRIRFGISQSLFSLGSGVETILPSLQ